MPINGKDKSRYSHQTALRNRSIQDVSQVMTFWYSRAGAKIRPAPGEACKTPQIFTNAQNLQLDGWRDRISRGAITYYPYYPAHA
jgi:hypothetical protein